MEVRTCMACREDMEEVEELPCSILQCTVSLRSSRAMEAMEVWELVRATIRWDMGVVEAWLGVCRDMEGCSNNLQGQISDRPGIKDTGARAPVDGDRCTKLFIHFIVLVKYNIL